MSLLSGKKILLLGFVVVLLVIIPLTVYLVQQQQKLKVGAAPASILSFQPSASTIAKPGDAAVFVINLDPGTNQVSFVKLSINYDATKLIADSLTANTDAFPTTLQPAVTGNGKATITLSVGSSADKIIKAPTIVAKITFKVASTATAGDTQIKFDPDPATQILSIASTDQFNENVLLNSTPATVTIAQAAIGGAAPTATPTPTPTATPTPTPTPTATPTPQGGASSSGGGTSAGGTGTGTTQVAVVASPTPAPTPQLTPLPGSTTKGGLPAAGPGDKIISVGGLGIVSIIIGALLLFGL